MQVVVFGEAVDERFAAHGIAPDAVTWDSRRRDDGEWVVVAEWLGGEGAHAAEWVFTRSSRTVTPIDDTAADLLSDRPIRPVAPPEPERPTLVAAPPLAPGVVAFPPMPDAHTGPVPVLEEVFDQEAPPEGPREVPRPASPPAFAAPPAAQSPSRPEPEPAAQPAAQPVVLPEPTAEPAPEPTFASASASAELDTFTEPTLDFDAPPLPLGIADPARPAAVAGLTNCATWAAAAATSPTRSAPPGPASRPGTTSCSACAASRLSTGHRARTRDHALRETGSPVVGTATYRRDL